MSEKFALFDLIPDAIFIQDRDGRFLYVNSAASTKYGIPKNDFLGKDPSFLGNLISISDLDIKGLVNESYDKKIERRFEFKGMRVDGTFFTDEVFLKFGVIDGESVIIASSRDISHIKEGEISLKKSIDKYSALLDAIPDLLFIFNKDYIIVEYKAADTGALYTQPERFIGKELSSFLPPFLADKTKQNIDTVLYENRSVVHNYSLDINGEVRYFESRLVKCGEESVLSIIRDITEKTVIDKINTVKSKISLFASNFEDITLFYLFLYEQLTQLLDIESVFLASYDSNKKELTTLFEMDDREQIGTWSSENSITGYMLSSGKGLILSEREIVSLIESKRVVNTGVIAKSWIGAPVYIKDKIFGAIVLQNYTKEGLYSVEDLDLLTFIANTVSIAIQHDKDLKYISLLIESVENSPNGTLLVDKNGIIEYANSSFYNIKGISTSLIGSHVRELKHENASISLNKVYDQVTEAMRNGQEWSGEFLNLKSDGSQYWEKAYFGPIRDSKGDITHYLTIITDISDLKNTMDELVVSRNRAMESDRLKSTFIANISHELRTPLNSLMGFTSIIKDEECTTEEVREYSSIIYDSAQKLKGLIENVMELSKVDSGCYMVKNEPVVVNKLIADITSKYHKDAQEKGLGITNFYAIEGEIILDSDFFILHTILDNLLSNAIKFSYKGVIEIGFGADKESEKVIFWVKDQGIGIPKGRVDKIFERFNLEDNLYVRDFEGAGLGLALCKSLANLIDAKIVVESIVNRGSTFFLEIPVEDTFFE